MITQEEKVIKKIEKYFKENNEEHLEHELYCMFWADVIDNKK